MRIYRSFAPGPLTLQSKVELDADEAHHLLQVRRSRDADLVALTNGEGTLAQGPLVREGKRGFVHIEVILRSESSPPPPVTVACALTKSGAFEDVLQRAVELGMTRFIPLITERTVVELDDRRADKKREKWQRHAIEALKQCERLWLPQIDPPEDFSRLLAGCSPKNPFIFLEERSDSAEPLAALVPLYRSLPVTLLIGPEGGWTDEEKLAARNAGAQPASLGAEAILRTETAWLAALAILGR